MSLLAKLLILVVALEHFYIMYIEMFAWTTIGKRVFKGAFDDELFEKTKTLAGNQGLYNGFLAAGLIWSLCIGDVAWAKAVAVFFLSCVIVASIYGAMTASKGILIKQGLPAMVAMVGLWFL